MVKIISLLSDMMGSPLEMSLDLNSLVIYPTAAGEELYQLDISTGHTETCGVKKPRILEQSQAQKPLVAST